VRLLVRPLPSSENIVGALEPAAIVARYHRALNEHDLGALAEVLDAGIELVADGLVLHGVEEVRAFALESGVRIESPEIVGNDAGTVVVELRLVSGVAPERRACEIHRLRDGRIVSCHRYAMDAPGSQAALAEEQRALRSLAMLVARGASQSDVFDAVVAETARLLGQQQSSLHRYEDGYATLVAAYRGWAEDGMRIPVEGETVTARVWRTGCAARVDGYDGLAGAETAHRQGLTAGAGAPIVVNGRLWGLIAVAARDGALPAGVEDRLAQFAELVAAAIGNAESLAELTASRARVVATADETRRQLIRDVHDGAQQRLVNTVISLKLARSALSGSPALELVEEALASAQSATDELRELAHGILPAALSRGLRAGVESLVDRVALPVSDDVLAERLPEPLEITAYFIVAESLTNVVKHAGASRARVRAERRGDVLRLEVSDDGRGGAARVVGLADRVAAFGGTLTIASPPGEGTTLVAELPIEEEYSGRGVVRPY
jgi:signal transduction histidine kinase